MIFDLSEGNLDAIGPQLGTTTGLKLKYFSQAQYNAQSAKKNYNINQN